MSKKKAKSKRATTPEERNMVRREKADREHAAAIASKRKSMRAAGIDHYDERTAHGSRSYAMVSMGGKVRVSLDHFNNCFRKQEERTGSRMLAWANFDDHCHRYHRSMIKTPNYEAPVDNSATPTVSPDRLNAVAEERALVAVLGRDMYGLMTEIIYHHRRYVDLAQAPAEERQIAWMFKRALDLAAGHYKVGEAKPFGRVKPTPNGYAAT